MRWECLVFTPSESPGVRSLPGPGCGLQDLRHQDEVTAVQSSALRQLRQLSGHFLPGPSAGQERSGPVTGAVTEVGRRSRPGAGGTTSPHGHPLTAPGAGLRGLGPSQDPVPGEAAGHSRGTVAPGLRRDGVWSAANASI